MSARRSDFIDELLRSYPNGRAVNPERSVIDIPFQLPNDRSTTLRVSLSPHFPQDRPVLCVLVPVASPAVDSAGRVHVRGLDLWATTRHAPADLVSVVQEALAALTGQAPPPPQGPGPAHAGAAGARAPAAAGAAGPGPGSLIFGGAFGGGPQGGAAAAGGGGGGGEARMDGGGGGDPEKLLEGLSTTRLEALLSDPDALRAFAAQALRESPAAKALADVRRQNVAVAADNLAMQRSIEEARTHVAIVRGGEYATMRSAFEELYGRQEAAMARLGPQPVLGRLRDEADRADAASDALLDRYGAGQLGLEALVEGYVAAREAFHTIDLKRQAAEHHMAA